MNKEQEANPVTAQEKNTETLTVQKEYSATYTEPKEAIYDYILTKFGAPLHREVWLRDTFENKEIIECAWTEKFRSNVEYSENSCGEGKGFHVNVSIPGMTKEEWYELISKLYGDSENTWNKEKTKFSPPINEPGCEYEIKQSKTREYILEYFCGC